MVLKFKKTKRTDSFDRLVFRYYWKKKKEKQILVGSVFKENPQAESLKPIIEF